MKHKGKVLTKEEVEAGRSSAYEYEIFYAQEVGEKIVAYAKRYEGTDRYNAIILAIEFGYQLALNN